MDASVTEGIHRTGPATRSAATYTGTSDEMYTKIKAGGGRGTAQVWFEGDLTKRLFDAGLIDPIDLKKVPNYKNLFPLFQNAPYNTYDGKNYGVSIAWGPDLSDLTIPEQVTDAEAFQLEDIFRSEIQGIGERERLLNFPCGY